MEIELPNFDVLFDRIAQVSPLARMALEGREGGLSSVDNKNEQLKWKILEKHDAKKMVPVHEIHKIDNFMNLGSPMLRFRTSIEGPCLGDRFANFIMDFEERKQWDKQIEAVEELYPINDVAAANMVMGFKFGECSRLGLGYSATKPNFVASGREQLTLCGLQEIPSTGASLVWGTEMEDQHNHLLPSVPRRERARSYLFSTALVPTGENTFDVEYCLQMDCGGNIPAFMTTPVLLETVKSLFSHAKKFYKGGKGSALEKFMEEMRQKEDLEQDVIMDRKGLLHP